MEQRQSTATCWRSQTTLETKTNVSVTQNQGSGARCQARCLLPSSAADVRISSDRRKGVENQTTLVHSDAPELSERREQQTPQNKATGQKILDELGHVRHRPARCGPPAQHRHAGVTTHWYPVCAFRVGLPGCLSSSNTPGAGWP